MTPVVQRRATGSRRSRVAASIVVQGDMPRMPTSGKEGRPIEVFIETGRGDLGSLPDDGLDSLAARVLHRPGWLFPPRS